MERVYIKEFTGFDLLSTAILNAIGSEINLEKLVKTDDDGEKYIEVGFKLGEHEVSFKSLIKRLEDNFQYAIKKKAESLVISNFDDKIGSHFHKLTYMLSQFEQELRLQAKKSFDLDLDDDY